MNSGCAINNEHAFWCNQMATYNTTPSCMLITQQKPSSLFPFSVLAVLCVCSMLKWLTSVMSYGSGDASSSIVFFNAGDKAGRISGLSVDETSVSSGWVSTLSSSKNYSKVNILRDDLSHFNIPAMESTVTSLLISWRLFVWCESSAIVDVLAWIVLFNFFLRSFDRFEIGCGMALEDEKKLIRKMLSLKLMMTNLLMSRWLSTISRWPWRVWVSRFTWTAASLRLAVTAWVAVSWVRDLGVMCWICAFHVSGKSKVATISYFKLWKLRKLLQFIFNRKWKTLNFVNFRFQTLTFSLK